MYEHSKLRFYKKSKKGRPMSFSILLNRERSTVASELATKFIANGR